jgi:hypothetical protein
VASSRNLLTKPDYVSQKAPSDKITTCLALISAPSGKTARKKRRGSPHEKKNSMRHKVMVERAELQVSTMKHPAFEVHGGCGSNRYTTETTVFTI